MVVVEEFAQVQLVSSELVLLEGEIASDLWKDIAQLFYVLGLRDYLIDLVVVVEHILNGNATTYIGKLKCKFKSKRWN